MSTNYADLSQRLKKNGWYIPKQLYMCLSESEKNFLESEFHGKIIQGQKTIKYYEDRLKALGFSGFNNVLDAGCGMGQWSMALSRNNHFVHGIDINMERLLVARELSLQLKLNNINYQYSSLENLPFENNTFDGVFCYSVFMFTHMPTSLKEFLRVLKPGGLLYVNVNSIGWYLHLIFDRGLRNKSFYWMFRPMTMILLGLIGFKKKVMVNPTALIKMLKANNFDIIDTGPEGICRINENISPLPTYPSKFFGLPTVTEVLARKGK